MDTAKAIAVEATHPGSAWDYLFFKTPPTDKTLPVIAVSTTSGTGSQVTQVAVMTETQTKTKSAIYHSMIYPKVAIVDPELMLTLPEHITASTGFDAFCHAFEILPASGSISFYKSTRPGSYAARNRISTQSFTRRFVPGRTRSNGLG